MSTSTHKELRKHPQPPGRIPSSNTGVVRGADLPSPHSTKHSLLGSFSNTEGQKYAASKHSELLSGLQNDTLRQRRVIPAQKSNVGENVEMGKSCDTNTTALLRAHGPMSGALKIESDRTLIEVKPSSSEMSFGNTAERLRLLSELTNGAAKLKEEQEKHLHRAQELRDQIKAGELACGRMTQQVLEAQETIRALTQKVIETREALFMRKRHIKEDEEELSQELRSREQKMEEVMLIVSRVNAIALETTRDVSIGDSLHVHESK